MKFLTRCLLPLVLIVGYLIYALNYEQISPRVKDILLPWVITTHPLSWSAFIYTMNAWKPGFYQTDFRFWSWRSYKDLWKKWFEGIGGRQLPALVFSVFLILVIFLTTITFNFIQNRYTKGQLSRAGISTRAMVVTYTPGTYRNRNARVHLRFVTIKGDTVTHQDLSLKIYTPGDSVTIRYLEKDPGFCEIVE